MRRINYEEIAFSVNHALLMYNRFPPTQIDRRIDWLIRAIAYLYSGLDIMKENGVKNEEDKQTIERAMKCLLEIRRKLKGILESEDLHTTMVALNSSNWLNPKMSTKLYKYINEVNDLRDQVVKIMIDTGFEKFIPLVIGGEENEH